MDRGWRGARAFFSTDGAWHPSSSWLCLGWSRFLSTSRTGMGWPGDGSFSFPLGWVSFFLLLLSPGASRAKDIWTLSDLGASAGLVSVLAFFLLAYAFPLTRFRADAEKGLDVGLLYPMGPATLGGLSDLRDRIEENPPDEFSFRVERPLASPPNWITYQIHTPFVFSLFAILAAFLGALCRIPHNRSIPPARKNARWATESPIGGTFLFRGDHGRGVGPRFPPQFRRSWSMGPVAPSRHSVVAFCSASFPEAFHGF